MESASCFFAAASTVYILTLLWALREGRGTGVWLAAALVGASLYQILPPALHGIVLLGCSFALIGATRRAVQLLPVTSKAVLITGEAYWLFRLHHHHIQLVLAGGGRFGFECALVTRQADLRSVRVYGQMEVVLKGIRRSLLCSAYNSSLVCHKFFWIQ